MELSDWSLRINWDDWLLMPLLPARLGYFFQSLTVSQTIVPRQIECKWRHKISLHSTNSMSLASFDTEFTLNFSARVNLARGRSFCIT